MECVKLREMCGKMVRFDRMWGVGDHGAYLLFISYKYLKVLFLPNGYKRQQKIEINKRNKTPKKKK